MARLLCYVVVLVSGSNWSRHTVLCHLLPYGGRTISIFYQFIQFLEAVVTADGRACCLHLFPSSPYRLSKAPAGQHLYPLLAGPAHSLVRSSTATPLPWRPSRVGWTNRKTKTKNIPSCFVSFTDEQTFQQVAEECGWPAIFAHDDFHRCRAASSATKI